MEKNKNNSSLVSSADNCFSMALGLEPAGLSVLPINAVPFLQETAKSWVPDEEVFSLLAALKITREESAQLLMIYRQAEELVINIEKVQGEAQSPEELLARIQTLGLNHDQAATAIEQTGEAGFRAYKFIHEGSAPEQFSNHYESSFVFHISYARQANKLGMFDDLFVQATYSNAVSDIQKFRYYPKATLYPLPNANPSVWERAKAIFKRK